MASIDLSGLGLEELNDLIEKATRLRDQKVEEKRAALLKELSALDAISSSKPAAKRSSPQVTHRGPDGETWMGRGAVPKWAEKYGVKDRAGMDRFKLKA
ncbi:hypothetical protein N5C66_03805 [Rhizobium pusense]|uniref:hypothetical protein n=1 Tax=Rhizobium/Agrobacterium group TaxID=227290 RepID=UPI0009BA8C6B|nr:MULTISPECIES: hypothetical protein [Rhizobium/Agrobacterium group]MDH0908443.1 hypothetical protein [Agrobacterium pusense]MDH1094275.1 hypothetical protein [Agrobacterium pusense]MDH1110857.1 hypothetical protein [Agrobacterium pusense]MDH2192139.1 hypothetical protein [Agrobacterium pusense]CAD7043394.1 hypothetical protein RP007_01015 [Rhizobium sp. P007]